MAEEIATEVVPEGQASSKKYVTATYDKEADSDLLRNYEWLRNIGGFGPQEIVNAGVKACMESRKYKDAVKSFLASQEE